MQFPGWLAVVRSVKNALLDFVFPPVCIICSGNCELETPLVCKACWAAFPKPAAGSIEVKQPPGIARVFSVWEYDEKVEKIVHEVKFFRKFALSRRIGSELSQVFLSEPCLKKSDMIIPVPLHKSRQRERGFNQSELLCEVIGRQADAKIEVSALRRVRQTKAQSKLNAAERAQNISGAFKVVKPELIRGKRVVLIDDVLTTGSTLSSCAGALLEAGAEKVYALTAAMTLLGRAKGKV